MRGVAQQIKCRGIFCRLARQTDRLAAATDIKQSSLSSSKVVPSTVTVPGPPEFSTPSSRRSQKNSARSSGCVSSVKRHPPLAPPTDDRAIQVHIRQIDLPRLEHALQQKRLAQFCCRHPRIPHRVRHLVNPHSHSPELSSNSILPPPTQSVHPPGVRYGSGTVGICRISVSSRCTAAHCSGLFLVEMGALGSA